jgi:thiamine biosynthesis lipoprotein
METVTLARHAMATRFEVVLHGENPARLRAAGEAALAQIDRLEAQWSLYRPASEIARVNALAARQPVRVSLPTFRLLQLARRLHDETAGAFDIAIAPLVRCWGFMDGPGQTPTVEELAEARRQAGMEHVLLDPENLTVRFDRDGAMIDLGAIGKGGAIDQAAETLREAGIESALIHGGTSTVYGIGVPPGGEGWKIAIADPPGQPESRSSIVLRDQALSVSAVWGKFFEKDGKKMGHVIDPRSGEPVNNAVLAAVALPSATESDALSTALLVLGLEGREKIARLRPHLRALVMAGPEQNFRIESNGFATLPQP